MRTDAVSIRTYVGCSNNSALYEIDNNVKYSLTCNNEKVLYAKNPHYGWQLCTVAQIKCLPPSKVTYAREFIGKEVLLDSGGNREKTTPEVNIIDDKNNVLKAILRECQQEHELSQNSCV